MILSQIVLLINIFFTSSCSHDNLSIEESDRPKIESFLQVFLFKEGGVFTLFGDKPLTSILFFSGNEEDLLVEGYPEPSKEDLEWCLALQNWPTVKKYLQNLKMNNFCFFERTCPRDPSQTEVIFINIPQVQKMLESLESRPIHRDKLIKILEDSKSSFWDRMTNDHIFAGLMYGFGRENAEFFIKESSAERHASEIFNDVATPENFPIPIYVSADTRTSMKYQKQRFKIIKQYKNKNIIDVTFYRLQKD